MKDSMAKTFSAAASDRKLAVRRRVGSMWSVTFAANGAYGGVAVRPEGTESTCGARPAAGWTVVGLSYFPAAMRPVAANPAATPNQVSRRARGPPELSV